MAFRDEDLLPLSALQHYAFCPRQCALIHVERAWVENRFTAEGRALHQHVHETGDTRRGDTRRVTSLHIVSRQLGLSGIADLVEYHRTPPHGWQPFPVEFKRGRPKRGNHDRVQLCAQAIALEEMEQTHIPAGALFYGQTKRRVDVPFDDALRNETLQLSLALHRMFTAGKTPPPEPGPKCKTCSLAGLCLPSGLSRQRAQRHVEQLFHTGDP